MTEYEYADVITSYATQAGTFFTIWLTILCAYALVAYTIGEKLNSSQVIWLNGLYVFAASLSIFGFSASFNSQVFYVDQLKLLNPESPQNMNIYTMWGITILAILGVFVTLKFMWDIRHPKAE